MSWTRSDIHTKRFVIRYELWLRGEDIGSHPEDPRQTAAPLPSQMDLLCANNSSGELPQSYLSAPKNKRHRIHRKKNIADTNPDVNMAELANRTDIPADVKKVLQDLELEETDDQPDEQQLEVLEDIWLKAGELDVCDALLYTEKGTRKKGRKRKKKPPNDKEPRRQTKPKKSAKSTPTEEASTSAVTVKTEFSDIIDGPVPCLVLADLKVHRPELLSTAPESGVIPTDSIKLEEPMNYSISKTIEMAVKAPKQKRKSTKNPGDKPKRTRVYKSKRKQPLPTSQIFNPMELLDVSDADVQRKLMAMPSLAAQKFAEPPRGTVGIGMDRSFLPKKEQDAYESMDVKPHMTTPEETMVRIKQEFPSDTRSVPSDSSTNPLSYIINQPVSTSLIAKPMATYVRKDLIKAPRLSVLKKQSTVPPLRSIGKMGSYPIPKCTLNSPMIGDDPDVSRAVDGLMVLQQRPRATLQDAKHCPNSNTMFATLSLARPNDTPTTTPNNSISGSTLFEPKSEYSHHKFDSTATTVTPVTKPSFPTVINHKFGIGLEKTSAWDSLVSCNSVGSTTTSPKIWNNQSTFSEKNIDLVQFQKQFSVGKTYQIAGQTSLILTTAKKNNGCVNTPFAPVAKNNSASIALASPSRQNVAGTPPVDSTIVKSENTIILKPVKPTTGRAPRKRMPVKIVQTVVEPCVENNKFSKTCSIATQVDNLTSMGTVTCTPVVDSQISQIASSKLPTNHHVYQNDNSVLSIRSQMQNVGPPNKFLSMSFTKEKKPPVSILNPKRKSKEKEKKKVMPVLSMEEQSLPYQVNCKSHNNAKITMSHYPAIPGHISSMLYPACHDLELMRAFNNYWAAQKSHCAVCAAFASSRSGSCRNMPSDWKYCKPKDDLPESSSIWVSGDQYLNDQM